MAKEVKCVLCSGKAFKSKNSLLSHFVEVHSIPKNDAILNRLVKGRFVVENQESNDDEFKIDAKKFEQLFTMCYDQIQTNKLSREKIHRMMRGQIASTSKKMVDQYPELSSEDIQAVRMFSKHALSTMKMLKKSSGSTTTRKPRKAPTSPPPPVKMVEETEEEDDFENDDVDEYETDVAMSDGSESDSVLPIPPKAPKKIQSVTEQRNGFQHS